MFTLIMSNLYAEKTYTKEEEEKIAAKRLKWTQEYFAKKGGPIPDGGVKVVPASQMASFKENRAEKDKIIKEIKTFGYVNKYNENAISLMNFEKHAEVDIKKYEKNPSPSSPHLRRNITDLKTAYNFVGVPSEEMTKMLGISPFLTYLKDQGWVGAAQFFQKEGLGNCAFSENNIKLSHGAVIIAQENARQDVNGKVTTIDVVGNQTSGFLYNVQWYDSNFFRQLECAHKQYSENIKNQIIDLAKKIDAYQ